MRVVFAVLGIVSAIVGAVFILIALVAFLGGTVRSVFNPELWIWIGLHAVSAFLSLVFFRLAAVNSAKGVVVPGEGVGSEAAG